MKKFFSKTAKDAGIHTIFAFTLLFITGILCMSQSIDAQSPLDSFNPNPSAAIRAVVVQPDGKIIIGGDFTSMPGLGIKHIARLNPDGSVDSSFAPNPNYPVYAIALQPDGKIIAGGSFTTVWGDNSYRVSRNGIARFNANGTLDNTFDPNPDSTVRSIVVQPNGKIIIGGSFTTVAPNFGAAVTRNRIARLNADGTLDAAFDPNADGDVNAAAIQTDGRIIIAGGFNTVAPSGGTAVNRQRVARFNADGTLDATFDLGLNNTAYSAVVQPDGKYIVGGSFSSVLTNGLPAATRNRIVRFNADGTLDAAFDPNLTGHVYSVTIQPDGRILAGGYFTSIAPNGGAPVTRNSFARVNMDGTLDTAFNPNINGRVYSAAVQTDGKIVFGGDFTGVGTVPRNHIHRLEKSGVPEIMMNQNTNSPVLAIAVQTDGKILIGGDFTGVTGTTRNRIARLTADSQLDTTFNPNANGAIYAIAVQADGKILIGGDFTNVGGQARNRIARLNANGTLDTSFFSSVNNGIRAFALLPDGKIIIGGAFTNISGQSRLSFARLTNRTAALSTLHIDSTGVLLTRDGAATQFSRVVFEKSLDNGTTWTMLGTSGYSSSSSIVNDRNDTNANPFAPTSTGYFVMGQTIPTGQNVLIRARGFYRAGEKNGSEIFEDKVQNVFLTAPTAGNFPVRGYAILPNGAGLRNVPVKLEFANGDSITTRTNAFGYFHFDEIGGGQHVTITVTAVNYNFPTQTIYVDEYAAGFAIVSN